MKSKLQPLPRKVNSAESANAAVSHPVPSQSTASAPGPAKHGTPSDHNVHKSENSRALIEPRRIAIKYESQTLVLEYKEAETGKLRHRSFHIDMNRFEDAEKCTQKLWRRLTKTVVPGTLSSKQLQRLIKSLFDHEKLTSPVAAAVRMADLGQLDADAERFLAARPTFSISEPAAWKARPSAAAVVAAAAAATTAGDEGRKGLNRVAEEGSPGADSDTRSPAADMSPPWAAKAAFKPEKGGPMSSLSSGGGGRRDGGASSPASDGGGSDGGGGGGGGGGSSVGDDETGGSPGGFGGLNFIGGKGAAKPAGAGHFALAPLPRGKPGTSGGATAPAATASPASTIPPPAAASPPAASPAAASPAAESPAAASPAASPPLHPTGGAGVASSGGGGGKAGGGGGGLLDGSDIAEDIEYEEDFEDLPDDAISPAPPRPAAPPPAKVLGDDSDEEEVVGRRPGETNAEARLRLRGDDVDLNRLDQEALDAYKKAMEVEFLKNAIKPGDPRYQHDVQVEFSEPEEDAGWDEDDDPAE